MRLPKTCRARIFWEDCPVLRFPSFADCCVVKVKGFQKIYDAPEADQDRAARGMHKIRPSNVVDIASVITLQDVSGVSGFLAIRLS